MREVLLMSTDIGRVPIVICDRKVKGADVFTGTILNSNSIHIQSLTKENCITELKRAFEVQTHFWLRNQLLDLNISYEPTTDKKGM